MKIGSLCTGYGGLDLAVEAHFNAKTVWCAEFDKYASQVIEQRFGITNHKDIKSIDWSTVEPIDILTAGYPCQPFSHAGKRKGTEDERHLFPYILEAIGALRPRFVILENVRGHLSLGFSEVLGSLTSIGYDARWTIVRASDVGAPHQRARLFIVAYPNRESRGISSSNEALANSNDNRFKGIKSSGFEEKQSFNESNILVDTPIEYEPSVSEVQGLGRKFSSRFDMHLQDIPATLVEGKLNAEFVEYMMGLPKGWVTDTGLSRAQQLKILGNGVVPQQAEYALELLCDTPSDLHLY